MNGSEFERQYMARALELALRGQGYVEPNPMVGCVIVRDQQIVGEGWHKRFGGPHAEVEALRAAGPAASDATLYVTLEPCCHQGKTPPCTRAIVDSRISRVVVAQRDPFPPVDGGGLAQLREAGIPVELGLLEAEATDLTAPYRKLITRGRPWVIGKWAMTLDGKIATRTGDSRWISNEKSRALVHQLRGRVDAILVGRGTMEADDPLLTARPPGPRSAARVVLDSRATLKPDSQLVRTAGDFPVIVVTGEDADSSDVKRLQTAGCEMFCATGAGPAERLVSLLDELGSRRMTNILVEGGGKVLGTLLDARALDEVHVFIAPKIVGGDCAATPVAGAGCDLMAAAERIDQPTIETLDGDIYLRGRV